MLPKPTSKGLKTWPDEDRAKINPRGKQVAVETEPVWLLIEPDLGWYSLLRAEFSLWGIRIIGFIDPLDVLRWLMRLSDDDFRIAVPQLAIINLDINASLFLPGAWDWILGYFRDSPILRSTAIVLLCGKRLQPKQEAVLKEQYTRVKNVIYKPLPEMTVLRKMLFEAVQ
jgi:hypothetical protein